MNKIIIGKPRFRSKIAAFDFDETIIKPKSNSVVPKDVDDWQWLRPNVPEIIAKYYEKGYGIYIFTNQSRKWKQQMIENVSNALNALNVPLTIVISFDKATYKPNPAMFLEAMGANIEKVKKDKSFYCGDALGRVNDHSDSDLKFGQNIGLVVKSPEDIFPPSFVKKPVVTSVTSVTSVASVQEIILMVGYPGSGKSTWVDENLPKYVALRGDDLKLTPRILKAAKEPLENKQSVVIDATNPTVEKRAEYIAFANKHNVPIRCVHISTPYDESLIRNNMRDKPVPKIAFNVYRKRFAQPLKTEGFFDVLTI